MLRIPSRIECTQPGKVADAFDGKNLLVCAKRCDQCLFSSAKIVGDGRKEDLLSDMRKTGKYFICHKSPRATPIICRGFFDEEPNRTCHVAKHFGLVKFVDPKDPHAKEDGDEKGR